MLRDQNKRQNDGQILILKTGKNQLKAAKNTYTKH